MNLTFKERFSHLIFVDGKKVPVALTFKTFTSAELARRFELHTGCSVQPGAPGNVIVRAGFSRVGKDMEGRAVYHEDHWYFAWSCLLRMAFHRACYDTQQQIPRATTVLAIDSQEILERDPLLAEGVSKHREHIYLDVPLTEYEEAKSRGLSWCGNLQHWLLYSAKHRAEYRWPDLLLPNKIQFTDVDEIESKSTSGDGVATPAKTPRLRDRMERVVDPNRAYIDVPYDQKDEAKVLGAKWDLQHRCWYVPSGVDRSKFRWADKEVYVVMGERDRRPSPTASASAKPVRAAKAAKPKATGTRGLVSSRVRSESMARLSHLMSKND